MEIQVNKATSEGSEIIFLGDSNVNLFQNTVKSDRLNSNLLAMNLTQLVREDTRPGNKPSLIDHIYCSLRNTYRTNVVFTDISDHHGVCLTIPKALKGYNCSSNPLMYVYKEECIEKIQDVLKKQCWLNDMERLNVEECVDYLQTLLTNLVTTYCKRTRKQLTRKVETWMTKKVLELKAKKHKALKKWQSNKLNPTLRKEFKMASSNFDKEFKKARKDFVNKKLSDDNPRKVWDTIREITNTNKIKDTLPDKFHIGNKYFAKENGNVANQFNNYFAKIPKNIHKKLPRTNVDPLIHMPKCQTTFTFQKTNCSTILKHINKIQPKTSYGYDNISNKLVKLLKYELLTPLTIIINKIMAEKVFPKQWKTAKIKPLHKKGEKDNIENYRPISLLPVLSKVAEKVLAEQITNYFETNQLFPARQYGFRKSMSTTHALLDFVSTSQDLKNKKIKHATVFIDFSKAFDVIDHKILFKKLRRYGFTLEAVELIKTYLSNREQYVEISGMLSDKVKLSDIGCPQGSCLGPLFYLIYTADMVGLFGSDIGIMFADDTTILIKLYTNERKRELEKRLEKYWLWFSANKLSMNISKTAYMTLLDGMDDVKLDDKPIERIKGKKTFRYLGLECNEKLNWGDQASKVIGKMKTGLYALGKIVKIADTKTKKVVFESLINSHFRYAAEVWSNGLSNQWQQKFKLIQKAAVRMIGNVPRLTHTAPLFRKNRILHLNDQTELTLLSQFHNHLSGKKVLPKTLSEKFKLVDTKTRQGKTLTSLENSQLLQNICKIVNKNIKDMEQGDSLNIYKKLKTEKYIDSYSSMCKGPSLCYICKH